MAWFKKEKEPLAKSEEKKVRVPEGLLPEVAVDAQDGHGELLSPGELQRHGGRLRGLPAAGAPGAGGAYGAGGAGRAPLISRAPR